MQTVLSYLQQLLNVAYSKYCGNNNRNLVSNEAVVR